MQSRRSQGQKQARIARSKIAQKQGKRRRPIIKAKRKKTHLSLHPRISTPTGTLTRDFKHLAVDMFLIEEEGKKVREAFAGQTAGAPAAMAKATSSTAAIDKRLQSTKRKSTSSGSPRRCLFSFFCSR